jgi:hypothetical protein
MLKDFKAFVMKGNVLDLAVAVIIGAAFGAIVTSMVNDIIMPPIGLILGHVDFKDLFISLNGQSYASLAAAKTAGSGHCILTVPEHGDQLPHHCVRDFRGRTFRKQVTERAAGRSSAHQELRLLLYGNSNTREAVSQLHFTVGVK